MSFARTNTGRGEGPKARPTTKEQIDEGKKQIGDFATKTAARPEVQAGIRAGKKGLNNVKRWGLGLIDTDNEPPQPPQQQPQQQSLQGGKRRRKSRRKKRTKRRRKSRRKKRRTKRRRKSRRKRRR